MDFGTSNQFIQLFIQKNYIFAYQIIHFAIAAQITLKGFDFITKAKGYKTTN